MSLRSILYDPGSLRIVLLVLAGSLLTLAYLLYRIRANKSKVRSGASGLPFNDKPTFFARLMRGALVLLALVVAVGFTLVLLPQGVVEKVTQTLQVSKAADLPNDKIALLYLGDEMRGKIFHIRGVVRNIDSDPVRDLDATIRLYAPDGALLETRIVRTDRDLIAPDEISEFHLSYSNYVGQFDSYSVDFNLRQGEPVSYKDRRGTLHLR